MSHEDMNDRDTVRSLALTVGLMLVGTLVMALCVNAFY